MLVTGDLKKAFLEVRIEEEERDALRFHWKPPNSEEILIFRFTRAVFGMTCSPFLLGGVINQHLGTWERQLPEFNKELRSNPYVDVLVTGGETVKAAESKKIIGTKVFSDATFEIRKWHSNAPELEVPPNSKSSQQDLTFAKQLLGGGKPSRGKFLGLPRDRDADTFSVTLKTTQKETTKGRELSQLASIYDRPGLASPTSLIGKQLCRDICDNKTH